MYAIIPEEFPDDCERAGLSSDAKWAHVTGILWCVRRGTGGYLDDVDVRRCLDVPNPAAAIAELLAVAFWQRAPGGYVVVHGMEHQADPEYLAKKREMAAERQRRKRRRAAGLDNDEGDDQ